MQHAIVVGAGVGGLGSALALSRRGVRVTLLERDATPLPVDADAAFAWDRTGAPQVRHSHAFLARLRNLLRDRHPDVLEALLDAGATELHFAAMLPEEVTDRDPRPGDEDLVALACRRTTFEWVLRQVVTAHDAVELEHGIAVDGLLAAPPADGLPAVAGVRTDRGDRRADLVVVANGRRSPLPTWLAAVGVEVPEVEEDTGIVYLSRFYRLAEGRTPPEAAGPIGGDLGYLKFGVFQGDDRTFSVTLAVGTRDRELRAGLLDPDAFERAAAALVPVAPWMARAGDALTPVQTMAGLRNRQRTFLDGDGRPTVLGLHAVGDAHTASNPLYGRGCSLALVMAEAVADATSDHADPVARAVAYEAAVAAEVAPWYQASVTADRQGRAFAAWQRTRGDDPSSDPSEDPDVAMAALLRDGLLPAVRSDPHVFRAFVRAFNLLERPEALLADPQVVGRVLACYQEREERPPEPPVGPDRAGLLEVVAPG